MTANLSANARALFSTFQSLRSTPMMGIVAGTAAGGALSSLAWSIITRRSGRGLADWFDNVSRTFDNVDQFCQNNITLSILVKWWSLIPTTLILAIVGTYAPPQIALPVLFFGVIYSFFVYLVWWAQEEEKADSLTEIILPKTRVWLTTVWLLFIFPLI